MDYIFLLYDVLAILIVFFCMLSGKKNGFAKTFIQTIGSAFAVVAALAVGRIGSSLLYTTFAKPSLVMRLEESIINAVDTQSVVDGLRNAIQNMPAISKFIFDFSGFERELASATDLNSREIALKVESTVIAPIIQPLLETLLFILTLVILFIIVGFLAKTTKNVNDVPVVGGINSFFGAITGIIGGGVVLCIIASLISLWLKTKGPLNFVSEEIIRKTYLFKYIYSFINGELLPF